MNLYDGTLPVLDIYVLILRIMVSLGIQMAASVIIFVEACIPTTQPSAYLSPYLRWRLRLTRSHKLLRRRLVAVAGTTPHSSPSRARPQKSLKFKVKAISRSRSRLHLVGLHNRRPLWLSSDAHIVLWKRRMLKWKAKRSSWKIVELGRWSDAPSLSSEATLVGKSSFCSVINVERLNISLDYSFFRLGRPRLRH